MRTQAQSKDNQFCQHGFTLIELLVVISIMALMMSILLPALTNAREQANRIHCLTNLRSLTLAWSMYAADNGDKPCSPDTYLNDSSATWPFTSLLPGRTQHDLFTTANWVAQGSCSYYINPTGNSKQAITNGALWQYIQTVKMYNCKSDKSPRLVSYAMSVAMGPTIVYPGIPRSLRSGYALKLPRNRAVVNLNEISKPSERMVLSDATTGDIGKYNQVNWLSGPFCPTTAHELNYSRSSRTLGSPDPPTWGRHLSYYEENANITKMHSNGCNLSFSDSHCEYWKWQDNRTIKYFDFVQIEPEDASRDNSDLERMLKLLYAKE